MALRLNAKTSLLECYCDLGVSETTYETQAAQRKLLEANLCDTYPNILFGAHPESQRLVAFAKINIFMLDDAGQVAMNTVTQLVAAAQAIRAW